MLCFLSNFQLSAQNGNIIENPSFEQFSGCSSYNEFQCGCYPKPFYQGCLGGAWKNATGTSALTNNWLNAGPAAVSGTYYAETRQYFQNGGVGNTHCSSFETFFYDFPSSTNNIPKLYAGQPYTLKLWYYGYNNPLQNENYKYNVHVDAVDGIINQIDNTACDDVVPNNLEIALHKDDISTFSSWVPLESNFTLAADKTQLWFKPELVQSSIPEGSYKTIDLFYDNISLTCNSLMTAEFQYTQNGSNYTFTLVKTGGPADVQIANVDWSFGDGTKYNGNPISKTISSNSQLHIRANFTDTRGCTKPIDFLLPSCGCSGNATIISNTQTWNTPVTKTGDILIMPGTRLTVQSSLNMGPNCKIVVLKGSRLNVDGGTIDVDDSSCNGVRWGGIEVLGAGNSVAHPSLSTITANNNYPAMSEHGVAYLSHATINRAQTAIQTEQKGQYLGGIVIADESNFNDNIIGADIGPFSQDNVSQFIGCKLTGAYTLPNYPANLLHLYGIKLTNNRGVQIQGSLQSSVNAFGKISNYQFGVYATDASYYLTGNNISVMKAGTRNIGSGIKQNQIKIGVPKPGGIGPTQNTFIKGVFGVYNNGSLNSEIRFNNFSTSFGSVHLGDYDINSIYNSFGTHIAGIYLNNTVTPSYKGTVQLDCNTHTNADYGILANQKNETSTFSGDYFLNVKYGDVEVYGTPNVLGTMQKTMGSSSEGISNVFSSPIRDFRVSSNTVHHEYFAQNFLNNNVGNAWIPRCPDNPDPLYDEECNYQSNFTRQTKNDPKFEDCLTNGIPPPYIGDSNCRTLNCLIQYINSLNLVVDSVSNYTSTSNYWNLLKTKESTYNSLFAKYLEGNNTDSLSILLSLENTETNKDRRIQYSVFTQNFSVAKTLVQSLPSQTRDEIDRVVLWYINIERVEKDSNFILQPNDRLFLNDVINNQRLYAPRAMAILSIIDGVLFDPILPTDTLEQRSNLAQEIKALKIYPNPASSEISIEIPDFDNRFDNTFAIYSLDGIQRLNGKINSQKQQVNLSQLCNGFYIVKLTILGEVTSKKLIISTH